MKNLNLSSTLTSQNGASMGGIIFNLAILVFIGFYVAKVGVFYFDNKTINNSLQDLKDVPYITKKSKGEVVEILRKKLQTNNIELQKDEVFVEKTSDKLLVDVIYERRVNMFSNIDAVVSFENHFEAAKQ